MTRPKLDDESTMRRRRYATEWLINIMLVLVLVLLGVLFYLLGVVNNLDAQVDRLGEQQETRRQQIDSLVGDFNDYREREAVNDCRILRLHDPNEPCAE